MEENRESITKFMSIAGVDEERAKFYLEANSYDIDVALYNFFDQAEEIQESDDDSANIAQSAQTPDKNNESSKPAQSSRFATVASLNHDSSSEEEDSGQAFYAGGSQHSGQQVLGPPRTRNQIVAEMFRSVREQGGEVVNDQPGSNSRSTVTFSGTGYRLGQTEQDTQVVSGSNLRRQSEVTVILRMWRSGFTVDDGPLRLYKDPENVKFLKTVSRGMIPEELLREAHGSEVNLNMEDHSDEDYVPQKPKLKVFSGKGNVLGSLVPGTSVAPTSCSVDPAADLEKAKSALAVDNTQPTTNVQVRMADGSRLVITLNHTHTISDLRTFIETARPEYANQPFRLLTSFPSKELDNPSATLASSQLLNAAILQRLG